MTCMSVSLKTQVCSCWWGRREKNHHPLLWWGAESLSFSFDLTSTARTSAAPSCFNPHASLLASFCFQKALPCTSIASTQTVVHENDKFMSLTLDLSFTTWLDHVKPPSSSSPTALVTPFLCPLQAHPSLTGQ